MIYPKQSLIKGLLFLLGMSPFYEQPRMRWHDKVKVLGLLLSVFHVTMTIYAFRREQQRVGYLSSNPNNIIQGTVLTKRLLTLLVPLGSIGARFCYIRTLERFWEKIFVLDKWLRSVQEPEKDSWRKNFEEKQKRAHFLAGLFVIVVETFCLVDSYLHYIHLPAKQKMGVGALYFFHFAATVFIAAALNIVVEIYCLCLRLDLFCAFVDGIWEEMFKMRGEVKEENPSVSRKRILDKFIQQYMKGKDEEEE